MSQRGEIVAGLDVGTTKICLLVGERTGDEELQVLGIGCQPSDGLRKGEVVNVARTVESIKKTLAQAENTLDFEIGSVYAGITGSHIESFNSRAVIPIRNTSAGVNPGEMAEAVELAGRVSLPPDREIIHKLPQEYAVDGRGGILEPEGIQGARLEARVHLVTARMPAVNDIVNCIHQAGLDVAGTVLQQLASSLAVVRDEEQEAGVVLIDIGGGTTDYAFFQNHAVHHTRVLSVGGDHVTNDIKQGMRLLIPQAEEVKKKYGAALADRVEAGETISIPSPLVRSSPGLPRKKLCRIVELRMAELFGLIREDLEREGVLGRVGSGVVLTGGGALLAEIDRLAARETGLPVRVGRPERVCGLKDVIDSPAFSTAVGLLRYGLKQARPRSALPGSGGGFLGGLRRWLVRYF